MIHVKLEMGILLWFVCLDSVRVRFNSSNSSSCSVRLRRHNFG